MMLAPSCCEATEGEQKKEDRNNEYNNRRIFIVKES